MTDFSQHVDIYCERLTPAFWAEPLNAITNTAFILAGIFALGLLRRARIRDPQVTALAIMTIIVGIGSFLFHTIATKGASLGDVIPIIIFIHYALYVIFCRIFGAKPWASILTVLAFASANALTIKIFGRFLFNGSITYVPTLIALAIIATYALFKRRPYARELTIAAISFLLSITARSLDQQLCQWNPLGTHFLWHILNAVTMYYVMKALISARTNP